MGLSELDELQYRRWKDWDKGNFMSLSDERAHYYRAELAASEIVLDPQTQVLEVGFGNGSFAAFCQRHGASYAATELDDELVCWARSRGLDAVSSSADLVGHFGADRFELVVAFDVLEHLELEDALELLVTVESLLRPGGTFLARFPNGDSPFSLAMQNGDWTHKSHIGSARAKQLCQAAGLVDVRTRGAAFPIVGHGRGAIAVTRRVAVRATQSLIGLVVGCAFRGVGVTTDPTLVLDARCSS